MRRARKTEDGVSTTHSVHPPCTYETGNVVADLPAPTHSPGSWAFHCYHFQILPRLSLPVTHQYVENVLCVFCSVQPLMKGSWPVNICPNYGIDIRKSLSCQTKLAFKFFKGAVFVLYKWCRVWKTLVDKWVWTIDKWWLQHSPEIRLAVILLLKYIKGYLLTLFLAGKLAQDWYITKACYAPAMRMC